MFTIMGRGPSQASDICQLNSRPKNSISRAVAKLVARGAVVKLSKDGDRRKEILSLTPSGITLCESSTAIFIERQRELMQPLDYDERRMLESLLK